MYERIVIIGSPGAGKSTLAQKLHVFLDIKVFHLDRYFWLPGWKERPITERIAIQQALVQEKRWIIEGTYLDSSDARLNAADTIIFLDMPVWLCMWQSIKRFIQYRNKQRADLAEGCREKLHWPYILKIFAFPFRGRRMLFAKIGNRRERDVNNPEKEAFHYVRLHSREEVECFLRELPALLQEQRAYAGQMPVQASTPLEAAGLVLTTA
jgi:adenylate kinase family enzyme